MSTPKGYTSQEKDDRLSSEHVTISKIGEKKIALDVKDVGPVFEEAVLTVEAGSTDIQIVTTPHGARVGDTIRFTSGALIGVESGIDTIVDANNFILSQTMTVAPAPGDTYALLRPVSLTLTPTGGLAAINTFVLDGSNQVVTEDTVTPANNRPLPVKLTGFDGDVNIDSTNLNLEVQLDHDSGNPDSVQIGDGTETMAINASNEAQVRDDDANTSLTAILADTASLDASVDVALSTRATESTLSTMNAKFVSGTDIGDVTINNGAAGAAVNIQDGGNVISVDDAGGVLSVDDAGGSLTVDDGGISLTVDGLVTVQDGGGSITVDAVNLDIRDLAHTQDSVRIGDGTELANVNASNELQVRDDDANTALTAIDTTLDVATSTRASESTLSTLNAKFVSGTDIGDVTINNPVGNAVFSRITDGVETAAVNASLELQVRDDDAITELTSLAGTVAGTELQVDVVAALPAGTNTIGAVDLNHLDVVDFMDTPLLDASSTNIPGSAAAPLEVIAATAAAVQKIQVFDTTGEFFGIFTGVAASEVLVAVVGPGSNETVEVQISAGIRISLRSLTTSAVTSGNVTMNLMG